MLLLEAAHLKKSFGDKLVLDISRVSIYANDKIGIVGDNGCGKTTLLSILAGITLPDEGFVKAATPISFAQQLNDSTNDAEPYLLRQFQVGTKASYIKASGGEQTRLRLAAALSGNSRLLFADEPTSSLDREGVQLALKKLEAVETLVLISHDRWLLDKLCNRIWYLQDGHITDFKGNYTAFKEQNALATAYAQDEYQQYRNEQSRLQKAIVETTRRAKSVRKTPARMGNSEARLHRRESTEIEQKIHRQAKTLETRLAHLEAKEKPKAALVVKMNFALTNPPHNKEVVEARSLSFAYGDNTLFKNTGFSILNGRKTALLGKNGVGKSTLLSLIADGHPAIRVVPKVKTGYFYQDFFNLSLTQTILENIMRTSVQDESTARTVLARLLFRRDDVYKKAGVLSGGERVRLAMGKLLTSNANLLLLDEPTNFLDIPSVEATQSLLREYEGAVVFVSHDESFTAGIAERFLTIENQQITTFEGDMAAYRQNQSKATASPPKTDAATPSRMILEMQMARVVSAMSAKNADAQALDAEYQALLEQYRRLS